jgi:hypothetical protein
MFSRIVSIPKPLCMAVYAIHAADHAAIIVFELLFFSIHSNRLHI